MTDGDRHVIKGRGSHRGKYLCYARHAATLDATDDGFVWLPDQRKAARWADPRYSGRTWATERARTHNGYFVKLVAPKAVVARVDELKAYIASHAERAAAPLACYWFDDEFHDAGEEYCRDCAEKLVDEKFAAQPQRYAAGLFKGCEDEDDRYAAAIDGGFDIDHDGIPTCETCGATLSGYLTNYGANEEIAFHTRGSGPLFNDHDEWAALDRAIVNLRDDDPRWRRIARAVDSAMAAEAKAKRAAAELAASPRMTEARCALLGLLQARAVQKAPDPSFRLWTEMCAWRARRASRRDATPEEKALERRLLAEAKDFAACLGFRAYWSCGMFMIKAPYGEYYWAFVVETEQYRLWNPPAFQEGVAYMLAPCPSGDPSWPHRRDANPYASDDERHRQWDCGYIAATAPASP